jgi:nitrite reductase (NO-forming)
MMRVLVRMFTVAVLALAAWSASAVPFVATVAKDPRQVPASPKGDVVIDLDVVEVLAQVAPGKTAWVWTFAEKGGAPTVPGPMIRVRQGNHVTINLCNTLENQEPHNIDFHASMGPGGGAAATNVMPGECKTLRFKASRAGSYIYHCAGEGMPWEHVAYGMYGLIHVDPPFGPISNGFKEFYVGQSDWYLQVDEALNEEKGLPAGTYTLDSARAEAEHPTDFSFNGHTKALADPAIFGDAVMVTQNDKVRFYFVTGGPNIGSNWHIIGTVFDAVYKGWPLQPEINEETVYVAPGSAAVFELSAPVPGKFLLVDHALFRVPKGAAGYMTVMCKVPRDPLTGSCPTWPHDLFSPEVIGGTGH